MPRVVAVGLYWALERTAALILKSVLGPFTVKRTVRDLSVS